MKKKYKDDELVEMVDVYAFNKAELDSQKTLCDKLNKNLKDAMTDLDVDKIAGTDVVATLVVQNRESINEEKMLSVLKHDWSERMGSMECPYIKRKEYVDMEALESAIYKGELSTFVLMELDTCKSVTEVPTLRLSKKRG